MSDTRTSPVPETLERIPSTLVSAIHIEFALRAWLSVVEAKAKTKELLTEQAIV